MLGVRSTTLLANAPLNSVEIHAITENLSSDDGFIFMRCRQDFLLAPRSQGGTAWKSEFEISGVAWRGTFAGPELEITNCMKAAKFREHENRQMHSINAAPQLYIVTMIYFST